MSKRRKGLGRGLEALLNTKNLPDNSMRSGRDSGHAAYMEIPLELIGQSQYQPRHQIDNKEISALAASIKSIGIIQPIVVRYCPDRTDGIEYELVAGERRWRACQLAKMESIPAMVKDLPNQSSAIMGLVENLQREDLNPIEQVAALIELKNKFELTHQQIADAVGKSRPTITNLMRLKDLAPSAQQLLQQGSIDIGHARALLQLDPEQQAELAQLIVTSGMSVRQTEAEVKKWLSASSKPSKPQVQDNDTLRLQNQLSDILGAPVQIRHNKTGTGKIVINYTTLDELEGILLQIKQPNKLENN